MKEEKTNTGHEIRDSNDGLRSPVHSARIQDHFAGWKMDDVIKQVEEERRKQEIRGKKKDKKGEEQEEEEIPDIETKETEGFILEFYTLEEKLHPQTYKTEIVETQTGIEEFIQGKADYFRIGGVTILGSDKIYTLDVALPPFREEAIITKYRLRKKMLTRNHQMENFQKKGFLPGSAPLPVYHAIFKILEENKKCKKYSTMIEETRKKIASALHTELSGMELGTVITKEKDQQTCMINHYFKQLGMDPKPQEEYHSMIQPVYQQGVNSALEATTIFLDTVPSIQKVYSWLIKGKVVINAGAYSARDYNKTCNALIISKDELLIIDYLPVCAARVFAKSCAPVRVHEQKTREEEK